MSKSRWARWLTIWMLTLLILLPSPGLILLTWVLAAILKIDSERVIVTEMSFVDSTQNLGGSGLTASAAACDGHSVGFDRVLCG